MQDTRPDYPEEFDWDCDGSCICEDHAAELESLRAALEQYDHRATTAERDAESLRARVEAIAYLEARSVEKPSQASKNTARGE